MIPTAWEHHSGEADVCLYPTICCTNISSECGKYWKVLQFLPNSCDKTWIRWINWSKFCPCASVWQVLTAKTVIVAFLSSPALTGHCTLLHLSSFPFFVENTQTKALIITLIPSSESALYPQFPCPTCCPCTAGLLFSLFSCPLPWLLSVCPWKEPSHSFFQCSTRDPLGSAPVSHSFSFPFYLLVQVQLPSPHFLTQILPCE